MIAADVPKSVIDVIARCTSKKLIERPATLAPVVDALQAAATLQPAAPRPVAEVTPGILSPSAQRPPSQVRLSMPPPPDPQKQSAAAAPAGNAGRSFLLVVGGAIAVALVIYGVVSVAGK